MKALHTLLLTVALLCSLFHAETLQARVGDIPLFKISKDGKYGYIDSTGKVIIEPIFHSAGSFSEGLAPARISGTYGYIDDSGKFVIKPEYDYATPFSEGLALVFKDAKPLYINKAGEVSFNCPFAYASSFNHGMALVKTKSGNTGAINKKGILIIDTLYEDIRGQEEGFPIVNDAKRKTGMFDSLGNIIIPLGKYSFISGVTGNYVHVYLHRIGDTTDALKPKGFVDTKGNLVLSLDTNKFWFLSHTIGCGLIKGTLRIPGGKYPYDRTVGFYDLNGQLAISLPNVIDATDFSNNRAIIQYANKSCAIINTKGEIVSTRVYEDASGFEQGYCCIKAGEKWGVIDTNENFVIPPLFDDIRFSEDSLFDFSQSQKYGIVKLGGNIIVPAITDYFNAAGFTHGLRECTVNEKRAFVNAKGEIIWQDILNEKGAPIKINTDSIIDIDYSVLNQNNGSADGIERFQANELSVKVDTSTKTIYETYQNTCKAITVYIGNRTGQPVDFHSAMKSITMNVQAQDKQGEWQDIEYRDGGFCGNAYYDVTLPNERYWTFASPQYEGSIKTKMRIKVTYNDPEDKSDDFLTQKKQIQVYSNEYEGYINPGQLWRLNRSSGLFTSKLIGSN